MTKTTNVFPFRTQPRLLVSLVFVILLFIFTDIMTKVDTDSWQDAFYILTLVSVVAINITGAIFQGE
jgi:equilibrative nucleoside transporter 1/2/3